MLPEVLPGEQQCAPLEEGDDIVANGQGGPAFPPRRCFGKHKKPVSRQQHHAAIQKAGQQQGHHQRPAGAHGPGRVVPDGIL